MQIKIPWKPGITKDYYQDTWYTNSWIGLAEPRTMERYEEIYNCKIITDRGMVTHIEFPSEGEATMFLLRWT